MKGVHAMNRRNLSPLPKGYWVGLVSALLLSGCGGKVPTWNELTNQTQTTPNQQQAPVIQSPDVTKVETPPPRLQTPQERAEEAIANFKKLRPEEVTDSAIAALT